jgi:hypothetical protein
MGPSQRDAPDGAPAAAAAPGAGRAAVAPGVAGMTGFAAGPVNEFELAAGGAVRAAGGAMLRCIPKLRPPPMRAASAKSACTRANEAAAARAMTKRRFT